MIRKRAKRLAGAVLAAGTITAMPFQAFAQRSPEFAYSAEKWATLSPPMFTTASISFSRRSALAVVRMARP